MLKFLWRHWGLLLIILGMLTTLASIAYASLFVWPLYRTHTMDSYHRARQVDSSVGFFGGLGMMLVIVGISVTIIQLVLRWLRIRMKRV